MGEENPGLIRMTILKKFLHFFKNISKKITKNGVKKFFNFIKGINERLKKNGQRYHIKISEGILFKIDLKKTTELLKKFPIKILGKFQRNF